MEFPYWHFASQQKIFFQNCVVLTIQPIVLKQNSCRFIDIFSVCFSLSSFMDEYCMDIYWAWCCWSVLEIWKQSIWCVDIHFALHRSIVYGVLVFRKYQFLRCSIIFLRKNIDLWKFILISLYHHCILWEQEVSACCYSHVSCQCFELLLHAAMVD